MWRRITIDTKSIYMGDAEPKSKSDLTESNNSVLMTSAVLDWFSFKFVASLVADGDISS